jgi:hypothetical protein
MRMLCFVNMIYEEVVFCKYDIFLMSCFLFTNFLYIMF